ncbi:MAG: hypothetical protein AB8G23_00370 [Myxococcota bacterium]
MFRRISEPLPLSEASMLALRPAMNAPVLNVNFLPVGPARAAIVAFAEEYGGIGMALGIRTNEGGHVAVIRNQESIDFDTEIAVALEPLLAEAERMGFLFDEDMVAIMPGGKGRAHALGLWDRLMGEVEAPPASRAVPPQPAANEPILELSDARVLVDNPSNVEIPELDLDDLADLDELSLGADDEILELDISLDEMDASSLEMPAATVAGAPPEAIAPAPAVPAPAVQSAAKAALPSSAPAAPKAAKASAPTGPTRRSSDPKARKTAAAKPAAQRPERRVAAAPKPEQTTRPAAAAKPLPPAASQSGSPTEAPEQTLSKFRNADQTAAQAAALPQAKSPGSDAAGSGNELGRIPLVRVRREREGSKRVPYLARLLSSF